MPPRPAGSISRSPGDGRSRGSPRWRTTPRCIGSRSRRSTTISPGASASRHSPSWSRLRAARRPRRGRRRPRCRRPRVRSADPAAALAARLLRLRAATSERCGSVAAARSPRPGTACRSSTSRTPRRSVARRTRSGRRRRRGARLRARGRARSSTRRSRDLAADRAEEAIGGFFVLNDWSARDLQRDETAVRLGPAKGKDFATSIGPWLVTPDELADARTPGATAPDLAMTATVNGVETSRGTLVGRAVQLRPDDRAGLRRRARCARATSSAAGPSAAVPAGDPRRDARALP